MIKQIRLPYIWVTKFISNNAMKKYEFKETQKQLVNPEQVITFDQLPSAVSFLLSEVAQIKRMVQPKDDEPLKGTEAEYIHSITKLAEYLDCSRVTAQKFKSEGKIPYRQLGRKVMFLTDDVKKAMESHLSGRSRISKGITNEKQK